MYTHRDTHARTDTRVTKSRGRRRERVRRKEGCGERRETTGTEMSHAESHRRLTHSRRVSPLRSPPAARARGLDAPVHGAWSRVPRELTRAAAREPHRSTARPSRDRPPTHPAFLSTLPSVHPPARRTPRIRQEICGGVARSRNCVPR